MAVLALASLVPAIVLTFPDLSTVSAAAPPVARDDVARTDSGDDGDCVRSRQRLRPRRRRQLLVHRTVVDTRRTAICAPTPVWILHTQRRLLRRRDHHLHHPRQHWIDSRRRGDTVWVDTGATGPELTGAQRRLLLRLPGQSVSITTAELLSNDTDPQGQDPDRRVGVRTRHRRRSSPATSPTGSPTPRANDPALINTDHNLNYLVTDTDGHVAQSNIVDPHPRQRRPQPTTRRPRRCRAHRFTATTVTPS